MCLEPVKGSKGERQQTTSVKWKSRSVLAELSMFGFPLRPAACCCDSPIMHRLKRNQVLCGFFFPSLRQLSASTSSRPLIRTPPLKPGATPEAWKVVESESCEAWGTVGVTPWFPSRHAMLSYDNSLILLCKGKQISIILPKMSNFWAQCHSV